MPGSLPSLAHQSATHRFTANGQRYTAGRRELVELLAQLGRPVTTYELLEARPKLTQSSVYRNLVVLEEMGVVQRVATGEDKARYELAEEIIGHHHHLICLACARVEDFVIPTGAEETLDTLLANAVAPSGFAPEGHRLDILGHCAECREQRGPGSRRST